MSTLAVVDRPGMAPYKAKKPPRAQWFDNDGTDDRYGVLVLRTHDVEVARELARAAWRVESGDMDEFDGATVSSGWTRLVPWGGDGGMWSSSPTPMPGYVPCVSFEVMW